MNERKSKEELYMAMQVTRIIRLSNSKFCLLCDDLNKSNLNEIAIVLTKARSNLNI